MIMMLQEKPWKYPCQFEKSRNQHFPAIVVLFPMVGERSHMVRGRETQRMLRHRGPGRWSGDSAGGTNI